MSIVDYHNDPKRQLISVSKGDDGGGGGGGGDVPRRTLPVVRYAYDHDVSDYVCGFGAAIVNIYLTFPINKLIFRQMLHGMNVRSATANLKADGFRHLYRGVGPPLIQRSITLSLMFGTFGSYHCILDKYANQMVPSPYARFCLAAFLAGSTEALLCPLERIQMLLQASITFVSSS